MEAIARLLYHVSLPLTRDDFYAVDLDAPLAHSPSLWYDKSRNQALTPPRGGPLSGGFRTAICLVCWLASANKMPKFKLLPLCNLQKLRQRQKILGGFLR